MTKITKDAKFDFSINSMPHRIDYEPVVFNTQDNGGMAKFIFQIKKYRVGSPLSETVIPELALRLAIGKDYESHYVVVPSIVDDVGGILEYQLTSEQMSHDGEAQGELILRFNDTQSMQIEKFKFNIEKSLLDEDSFLPIAQTYVERWEDYETVFNGKVNNLQGQIEGVSTTVNGIIDGAKDEIITIADPALSTANEAKELVQNSIIASQSNNGIMAKEDKIMLDDTQAKTNKIIDTTTSIQYIYVDAAYSQTDSNGSQDKPYKTIQSAVDSLAYLKSKDVYIYVRSGDYLETVMLKGNMVSSLWIQSDPVNTTQPNVRSINIFDCFGYMRVSGFNFTDLRASGDRASIRFSRCLYGGVRDCTFEATNTLPAVEFDGSTGSLASSSFKNQTIALNSINGSNVRVDDNTASTGNALFAYIQSANVYINGTGSFIKSFTKQFNLVQGGNLNLDIVEQDPVLANGWAPYNTTTYVPKIRKTTDGKIKFSGLIKDGTVGQGINAITLPAGLRPLKNVVYPAFSSDSTIAKIIVDRTGNFVVEKSSGTYVALDTVEFQGDRETFIF